MSKKELLLELAKFILRFECNVNYACTMIVKHSAVNDKLLKC
jgi:hypothetical protein